jgi:hypothetical protein
MKRLAVLLLVLPVVAGCGGDTVSLDPIAQAATRTTDVASARFTMSGQVSGGGAGVVGFSGRGAYAEHGTALQMRAALDKPRVALELRLVRNTFYVRTPLFGPRWLSFTDRGGDVLAGVSDNDPAQLLEFLRSTADIDEVGSATIRGVATTHYRAQVQLERLVDRARPEQRERLRELAEKIKAAGIDEIPLEVWIGDDGLVRRIAMDWTISNPDRPTERATIKLRMDLFAFGAAVRVEAPSARNVIKAPPEITGG